MPSLTTLRNTLERKRGQQEQIQNNITDAEEKLARLKIDLQHHEEARELIKQVGLKTQETLAFHISDITSLALQAVFDDPYDLIVEFVERRNKTECDLLFEKDGNRINPIDASGGGVVDVASFALRVASWSMNHPRNRNTIILDEPMRFLSTDLQPKASQMLKQLSEKLGLQFIIITHEEELTAEADKVFVVSQSKDISKVTEQ